MDIRDDTPWEVRVGVRELRANLTHYLRSAGEGAAILVTSHDEVIAEIRQPRAENLPPRQPGALKGRIWMADDVDDLPEDILAAMER